MPTPTLYGSDGQPIRRKELTEEVATPSLTGIRQVFTDSIVAGLTPQKLASLIRDADEGDAHAYLTLAEEMEERCPHYGSVIRTRKLAIVGLDPVVEPAGDDAKAQEIAAAVRDLVQGPNFRSLVASMADALSKGYSVVEINWQATATHWKPASYTWRDARWFQFDQATRSHLRLRSEESPDGIPLPPYKFIVHYPNLKTGIPIRGGLARMAAWFFVFKYYGLKDWLAFAEVFGLPLRIGRYSPSASEEDKRALIRAVANLGTDAAAVLPEGMRIEFVEVASSKSGAELFEKLCNWLDRQISKGVLGQTMTTDDGSSKAQAVVHDDVRVDLLKADGRQLAETFNRDVVRPYVDLNYGPQEHYPVVRLPVHEEEDLDLLTQSLARLLPFGLRVSAAELRGKFGLKEPEKGEEVLGGSQQSAQALNRLYRALNRTAQSSPDGVDALAADMADEWEEVLDPVFAPFRELVNTVGSLPELAERLPELAGRMDTEALQQQLALGTFKARGLGDTNHD